MRSRSQILSYAGLVLLTLLTKSEVVFFFSVVMYRCKTDHKEYWVLKNWCFWTVVLEKTLESPLDWKEIKSVNLKGNQPWTFIGRTDAKSEAPVLLATWCEESTHWKRPWCWERLKAGGKGVDRGWDGWIASSAQWTWVWANFGRWWRTGRPGVLQCVKSRSDMTEQMNNKFLILKSHF